jgi:hypothetical protein
VGIINKTSCEYEKSILVNDQNKGEQVEKIMKVYEQSVFFKGTFRTYVIIKITL